MERTRRSKLIRWIALVSYIIMIAVNGLAESIPLNGQTTGEVSDKYSNLFAPAGYTFAIWGLIYFLLALYTLYQLPIWKNNKNKELLDQIGIYFSISSIANALWIFDWHYEMIGLTMVLMILILLCLIQINSLIVNATLSNRERVFVRLPFSIYFGWITIATIANATTLLVSLKWDGFGLSEATWTVIILIVGVGIGVATLLTFKEIAYGLTMIWGYTGILVKHLSANECNGEYPAVILTASISIFILSVAVLFLIGMRRKSRYS